MKTLFLAATAVLSIGIGSAYAGDGDGNSVATRFTQLSGQQPTLAMPAPSIVAAAPAMPVTHAFVTRHSTGTWLFPPAQDVGG